MTTTSVTTRQPERNGRPASQVQTLPGRAAGPQAGGGAQPGPRYYTKHVSAQRLTCDDEIQRDRRRQRGDLLDTLNRVSSLKRCQECGWAKRSGRQREPSELAVRDGRAYWRRVQRCASIHACPVCAAKIRRGRALEISTAAATWIDAGNECFMITLTAPHDLGMSLAALLLMISAAFRHVISGRAWLSLKDELGIVGTIRSLETTCGPSGWHPHLHVLVFVRGQLDAAGLAELHRYFKGTQLGEKEFPGRWGRFIRSVCRSCGKKKIANSRASDPCVCGGPAYKAPSFAHGVQVERCYSGTGAAEYICKTELTKRSPGNELARADMKAAGDGRRVPFEILASAGEGDAADLQLWHEYEQATSNHQCITWSKGLRELIQAAGPERVQGADDEPWLVELTDDELAAMEVNGEPVARVDARAMDQARGVPGFRVLAVEALEDHGIDGLAAVAAAAGFGMIRAPGEVPLIVPGVRLDGQGLLPLVVGGRHRAD